MNIGSERGAQANVPGHSRVARRALALACWPLLVRGVAHAADQSAEPEPLVLAAFSDFSHDDNLYRLPDNYVALGINLPAGATRADHILRTGVVLEAHGEYGRQKLYLTAEAADQRFSSNTDLNNTAGRGEAGWDWETGGGFSGTLRANYSRWLNSFANNRNFNRDLISRAGYAGTVRRNIGARWTLVVGAGYSDSTHGATVSAGNDLRGTSANGGVEYETRSGRVFGWDYQRGRGRYTDRNYDYDDDSAKARWALQLSPELKFAGAVGAQRRDYVNAPSRNFSGGVWNADLTWRPRERSSVTLSGWRELRAWQDAESNHYVSRGVRVEPAWDSGFHWRLSLAASWERDAYLDRSGASSREDTLKYVEAQLRYQFLKHLQLRLSGRTERRDSSNAAYDYDTRVAGAGIAASW